MITEDGTGTEMTDNAAPRKIVRMKGEEAHLVHGRRPLATENGSEAEAGIEIDDTGSLRPRGIDETFGRVWL